MSNDFNWNFKHEKTMQEIPVGEYRIRIAEAVKQVSQNGNDMIKLKFDVSGFNTPMYHYIVFMSDRPEITNRNLTQLFDSFGIPEGEFNLANWVGKVGGCKTKEDEYGAKVQYFLSRKKVDALPAWQEPKKGGGASGGMSMSPVKPEDLADLPF